MLFEEPSWPVECRRTLICVTPSHDTVKVNNDSYNPADLPHILALCSALTAAGVLIGKDDLCLISFTWDLVTEAHDVSLS